MCMHVYTCVCMYMHCMHVYACISLKQMTPEVSVLKQHILTMMSFFKCLRLGVSYKMLSKFGALLKDIPQLWKDSESLFHFQS